MQPRAESFGSGAPLVGLEPTVRGLPSRATDFGSGPPLIGLGPEVGGPTVWEPSLGPPILHLVPRSLDWSLQSVAYSRERPIFELVPKAPVQKTSYRGPFNLNVV